MIKAVLFDLDDTLLRLNTDSFIQDYLAKLASRILKTYPALAAAEMSVGKAIVTATQRTIANLDPTFSNAQVFIDTIADLLSLPKDDLWALFERFYADDYLQLAGHATRIAAALPLIAQLQAMGVAVVIATNPVFSLRAVMLRMSWAGLDTPPQPYALIASADSMHFTKPNPHFYEEALARIGVEADEAIMVGDDFAHDIAPASQAGLNTFWIDWGKPLPNGIVPDGSGTLADFEQQVASGWLARLRPRLRTADQVIPRMLGNVGALCGLIEAMRPEYWNMRPDPHEWSPLETVCHLRDSERSVQRPRLQRIAVEDNPFIAQPQDPPGPGERDMSGEDGYTAFRDFWSERCRTLEFIVGLRPEDWSRPARHSIFGPTTLLEMAHFTTRHDHLHINQLCETSGRCGQQ